MDTEDERNLGTSQEWEIHCVIISFSHSAISSDRDGRKLCHPGVSSASYLWGQRD
jgi:hypothetical protein